MSFSLSAIVNGVENLYGLHEIAPSDREVVGDRAFDLANFMQRGHSVIPGFVVSANIYRKFLETLDWREPLFVDFATSSLHIDLKDPRQLQAIAQRIRHQILTSRLSSQLRTSLQSALKTLNTQAFRFHLSLSSPSIPTDGLFDPVMSWANLDDVEQGIKQAWAELFRARNLLYWQHNNIQLEQLQPTLLVQLIPEAIANGSVQINPEFWKIQVSAGLDLADLWGQTHPDSYDLDPQTQTLQVQHLGYKIISYHLKSSRNTQQRDQDAQWREFAQCSLSPVQSPIAVKLSKSPQDPVLNSEQLRSLIEFIQPIATDLGPSGLIEWTLSELGEFALWSICIPNGISRLQENLEAKSEASASDFKGVAASAGQAMGTAYVMRTPEAVQAHLFPTGSILVAKTITPDLIPLLKRVGGLVTEQGGMTGHGAILARELGIPAVIGVSEATEQIKMGESIWVDGDRGEVYRVSSRNWMQDQYSSTVDTNLEIKPIFSENLLQVPIATQLMVNVSQSSSWQRLQSAKNLPIDGVGLVRSELMVLDVLDSGDASDFSQWLEPQNQSKFIEAMAKDLQKISATIAPRPLFYRALDLREFHGSVRPFWHGEESELIALTRFFNNQINAQNQNQYSTLFELEIAVLNTLYQSGADNIRLVLPFVRSVEEFKVYRSYIERTELIHNPRFQVWIMAEVPSVVFLLSEYIQAGVQGIAIGTNDLSQFLLGIDRNQTHKPAHLNELNPAMLKVIQQLITEARTAQIPCSICGDAPVLYPELINHLIRWGVTSISVNPDALERTYLAIARAEKLLMLEHSRSLNQ